MRTITVTMFLLIGIVSYSQVIINEVQSSNSSTIADNNGDYEDWIELYNPNDFPVDVAGLVLKDQVDTWQIPTGDTATIIKPYGFLLLWADDEVWEGKFHTNFKLSASNGEFLGLFEPDSVTTIETVTIPPLNSNQSFGKCNGNWIFLEQPTPMAHNTCNGSNIESIETELIAIYPSITTGLINIERKNPTHEVSTLAIYSLDGKLVLQQALNEENLKVDLSHLPPMVYVCTVTTSTQTFIQKLILIP